MTALLEFLDLISMKCDQSRNNNSNNIAHFLDIQCSIKAWCVHVLLHFWHVNLI